MTASGACFAGGQHDAARPFSAEDYLVDAGHGERRPPGSQAALLLLRASFILAGVVDRSAARGAVPAAGSWTPTATRFASQRPRGSDRRTSGLALNRQSAAGCFRRRRRSSGRAGALLLSHRNTARRLRFVADGATLHDVVATAASTYDLKLEVYDPITSES